MSEYDLIKEFVKENPEPNFMMPPDNIILLEVASTNVYLREYFEWKGKRVMKRIEEELTKDEFVKSVGDNLTYAKIKDAIHKVFQRKGEEK